MDPIEVYSSQCFPPRLPTLSGNERLRSYFERSMAPLELHMSGVSSQDVSSGVDVLQRKSTENCTITELAFVFGKARVAPKKALTVPELLLQASLLAALLRRDIQNAFTINIENNVSIVRPVTHVFYRILGNSHLTVDILATTFCLVGQRSVHLCL